MHLQVLLGPAFSLFPCHLAVLGVPSRSYCCQPYLPRKQYVPRLVLTSRIRRIPLPAPQPHQLCPGAAGTLGTRAWATRWHSAITPSGSCPLPLSHLGFVIEHSGLCQNMSAERDSREPLSNSTRALLWLLTTVNTATQAISSEVPACQPSFTVQSLTLFH